MKDYPVLSASNHGFAYFSKGSTIEVYSILADGIKLATEFSIYGFISKIQACTIPVSVKKTINSNADA